MKLLVAIQSDNNAKELARKTLLWAPRAGYNMRLFIPDQKQFMDYQTAIDNANYEEYLDLQYAMIVVGQSPQDYALAMGFDLLVTLPDDMKGWNNNRNKDLMVIEYAKDLGATRLKFSQGKLKKLKRFDNGAIMRKL